jgi:undecaprenyl pyrophosphate synthase
MKELLGKKTYNNIKKQTHKYKRKTVRERVVVVNYRTREQLLALCKDIIDDKS